MLIIRTIYVVQLIELYSSHCGIFLFVCVL